jgi:hypothetical protein
MTPEEVITVQESSPALYYPRCQPKSVYPSYKLAGAIRRYAEVLVLGSSRMNCIRGEFVLGTKDRFYNAAIWGADVVGYMRQFLQRLPQDRLPRKVILGIDPWWFRKEASVQPDADSFQPASRLEIVDFGWRTGLWWITQRQAYSAASTLIGISAKSASFGLRPDGSFFPGPHWFELGSSGAETQLKELRDGADPWFRRTAPGVSGDALGEMERLLTYCRAHGIMVIGYISPLHPELYEATRATLGLDYYQQMGGAVAPLFKKQGFPLFDFQDPAVIGCTAFEFLDGLHETEVCTARALVAMANSDARVKSIFDTNKLGQLLIHRSSEWRLGI